MRRPIHRAALLAVLLALLAFAAPTRAQSGVAEEDFTVTLGDGWVSNAKLTYPAGQPGPFPTVLLSYPTDLDFTITADARMGPGAEIFKDTAAYLNSRGIAVARFNGRYITSATERDEKAGSEGLSGHAEDIERVLPVLRAHPKVDSRHLFLYGWSASTQPAAYVATRDTGLAGLILQGVIASTTREDLAGDYREVGLQYALQFAQGGMITADSLKAASEGPGTFARYSAGDFQDLTSTDAVKVSPILDTNGDGVLDPDAEIIPNLGALVDADPVGLAAWLRALPDVQTLAPSIGVPVLVLQGEGDTSTRAVLVRRLDAAFAGKDYTAKFYPGLGHALAPLPSRFEDQLVNMADGPKADFADWVLARSAPAALPRTAGAADLTPWLLALGLLGLAAGAASRRTSLRQIGR